MRKEAAEPPPESPLTPWKKHLFINSPAPGFYSAAYKNRTAGNRFPSRSSVF